MSLPRLRSAWTNDPLQCKRNREKQTRRTRQEGASFCKLLLHSENVEAERRLPIKTLYSTRWFIKLITTGPPVCVNFPGFTPSSCQVKSKVGVLCASHSQLRQIPRFYPCSWFMHDHSTKLVKEEHSVVYWIWVGVYARTKSISLCENAPQVINFQSSCVCVSRFTKILRFGPVRSCRY